jgi:hypothetical protein|tara:strand:- start:234 stop:626 length:393 start_codon:yes stop_codon:yes gene_type:complete
MTDKIIKEALQDNKEGFAEAFGDALSQKINEALKDTEKRIGKELFERVEEVNEDNAFVSVITDCLNENVEINLDLSSGERVQITPDIASLLSETHDNLPKEMQQSFREMVFESKDKYTKILETIVTGEEQ